MKTDILNRTEFVNRIVNFVDVLSDSKKGICFAISVSLLGEGCSICVDDENTLAVVEKMFAC